MKDSSSFKQTALEVPKEVGSWGYKTRWERGAAAVYR